MGTDNRPIGIFDSGLGGLTAVKCIVEALPNEKFVYFGDTARTPYGSKSVETIKKFSLQIVDFLVAHDVKVIVIACNTVSATCLAYLRRKYPEIPILGIIEPVVQFVTETMDESKKIGVIGTRATINSRQYETLIQNSNINFRIKSKACPLFVPIIEEGIHDRTIIKKVINYYLYDFLEKNHITDLILGCTHYSILQGILEELYRDINIINPSEIIAQTIKDVLEKCSMCSQGSKRKNHFYASDLSEGFKLMIDDIFPVEHRVIDFKDFDQTFQF